MCAATAILAHELTKADMKLQFSKNKKAQKKYNNAK